MGKVRCKSCDAEIDFVKTETGKWMPVNPERIDVSDAVVGDVLVTDSGKVVRVTEVNRRGS